MTLSLTFGVDPGQSGAIAVFADGEPTDAFDMPCVPRAAGGDMVAADQLAVFIRGAMSCHPGADVQGCVEKVSAIRGNGVTGMFRFGQADGIARGVFGALRIPLTEVTPQKWKGHFGLIGTDKDAARELAIAKWPGMAHLLKRKRDCGRADALLIGAWLCETYGG